MTHEQFAKAVFINKRIEELNKVKEEIKGTSEHRLWYAYKHDGINRDWSLCSEWVMKYISEILDKHDKMIRDEIEAELLRLEEDIARL